MKLNRLRLIVGAIIVLLIAVLIAGWFFKDGKKASNKSATRAVKVDENVLMGMTVKIPGNEQNGYWELKVEKFSGLEQIGRMKRIKGDYFLDGKPIYHVTAQSGEINWESRQLRLVNRVEFSSNDGKKLSAQEFLWDPVRNRVFAEEQVKLSSPELVATTHKLEADPKLDKVVFKGETKFIYQLKTTPELGKKSRPRGER